MNGALLGRFRRDISLDTSLGFGWNTRGVVEQINLVIRPKGEGALACHISGTFYAVYATIHPAWFP